MALLNTPLIKKFFSTMGPKLTRYITTLGVTDPELAQEILSRVKAELCEKLNLLPKGTNPFVQFNLQYLCTMCRNAMCLYYRDHFVADREALYVNVNCDDDTDLVIRPRVEQYSTAMDEVYDPEHDALLIAMHDCLAALPERKRELFLSHYVDGESYEDLASRFGFNSADVAKVTNNRIRHELRLAIQRRLAA